MHRIQLHTVWECVLLNKCSVWPQTNKGNETLQGLQDLKWGILFLRMWQLTRNYTHEFATTHSLRLSWRPDLQSYPHFKVKTSTKDISMMNHSMVPHPHPALLLPICGCNICQTKYFRQNLGMQKSIVFLLFFHLFEQGWGDGSPASHCPWCWTGSLSSALVTHSPLSLVLNCLLLWHAGDCSIRRWAGSHALPYATKILPIMQMRTILDA